MTVSSTSTDEELLVAFRERHDAAAFDEMYRRERRAVFAVCLRFVRQPDQAEDLCHAAFVRAWERHADVRGSTLGPWIRRIAAHLALNRLRDGKGRQRLLDEVVVPATQTIHDPDAERRALAREEVERVARALRTIDPVDRAAFLDRHLEGRAHDEIASRAGIGQAEVRVVLQRARRAFLRALQREKEVTP